MVVNSVVINWLNIVCCYCFILISCWIICISSDGFPLFLIELIVIIVFVAIIIIVITTTTIYRSSTFCCCSSYTGNNLGQLAAIIIDTIVTVVDV